MFIITISDVICFFVLAVVLIAYVLISIADFLRQRSCQHEFYNETSACDAICKSCGKNLGFIGVLRDKKKGVS